jgi:phosphoglycerate dehydrogenase-like enzyme
VTEPRIVLMDNGLSDMEVARALCPAGFDLSIQKTEGPAFLEACKEAEYLVGFGHRGIDAGFYRGAPKLRLLQLLSAGYDTVDIEAARAAKVPVCNNGGANATAVAEHAVMLMLAVAKRLVWQHQSVVAGRWRGNAPSQAGIYELRGKVLGIVGLGTIGKRVARLAQGFGVSVIYFDVKRLTEAEEDALNVRFRLLNEVLRGCDILSLHVPLLPATKHMIGAAELAMMKPGAFLVNTCRGPVIDEKALIAALDGGHLGGAGLDVFDVEPTPADNPLLKLPNVVLSPHLAGPTADNQQARFRNAFDNCQRVARGERPLWIIPELA